MVSSYIWQVPPIIASLYGLRVCEEGPPRFAFQEKPKIFLSHQEEEDFALLPLLKRAISPIYMRDNNSEVVPLLNAALAHLPAIEAQNWKYGLNGMLTNTPSCLQKMELLFPYETAETRKALQEYGAGSLKCEPIPGHLGIWALIPENLAACNESQIWQIFLEQMLQRIGGTPSLYCLYKASCNYQAVSSLDKLQDGLSTNPLRNPILRVSEELYPGAYAIWIAATLLANLAVQKGLIHNCQRQVIENALEAIALFQHSAKHVDRFFEIVADEVFISTSLFHPYTKEQITTAWKDSFITRHPEIRELVQGSWIFSGGMDSITSCLYATGGMPRSLAKNRDYCESVLLCQAKQTNYCDNRQILYVTPNPSFPCEPFPLPDILRQLEEAFSSASPVILIIDATVETYREVDAVHNLLLALNPYFSPTRPFCVCVAKTFVKYTTLGTGKSMAGGVLLLRHPLQSLSLFVDMSQKLDILANELNWSITDDAQFLCHILIACPQSEIALVSNAASNAELFLRECWPGLLHLPGLPFLAVPKHSSNWKIQSTSACTDLRSINVLELVSLVGMEDRDSFSSLCTSFLSLPNLIRFNIGHECRNELLRKYSCLGVLLRNPEETNKKDLTMDFVQKVIEETRSSEKYSDVDLRIFSLTAFASQAFTQPQHGICILL